jgi:hypothetical protein
MANKKPTRQSKVEGRGTAKRPREFQYPKRYEVVVDLIDDDRITITRRAENLSAHELYGLLRMLMLEIERQIRVDA